ncbi:MAG TPA: fused MFS/spermidine synthase [Anaerolineales bacterium]|nr:fused MFS/spermidine synthase [Anaerolineales bacterium]
MNRYLYFAVFSSGMTVLALELAASRLLGSSFGTSNLVWASIIGLILIYLTVGYFIGGRWADRSPYPRSMYSVMAWGAFTAGLIPAIARPVLRLAANAFDQLQIAVLFGSFAAMLILFLVPITLLGTMSPFAIRLAISDPAHAGQISGRIYAISTLGSFIGTFLPELLLIPLIGTAYTFLAFSMFLLLVAFGGLWLSDGWKSILRLVWMPLVLIGVGAFLAGAPIKDTAGQIYETESSYNYIQVLEVDGFRYLRLNEGQGIHSTWHPTELAYDGPWEQFLAGPFFSPTINNPEDVKSMAIVGLAAGTSARQATAVFGPIPIDGYEIDPEIITVGQRYFDMNMPNLNAIGEDGRWGLEHSPRRYTLIAVDAYRPPYIPWHLTTQEFFQAVYDHLEADGVMVINVGRAPDDRSLIDALVGTIQTVFPTVHVMDLPGTFNSILYATRQPTKVEDLYQNVLHLYNRGDVHPLLIRSLTRLVTNLQPTPQSQIVYTDDWAPIELMTNSMVLKFVLLGDMERLK